MFRDRPSELHLDCVLFYMSVNFKKGKWTLIPILGKQKQVDLCGFEASQPRLQPRTAKATEKLRWGRVNTVEVN